MTLEELAGALNISEERLDALLRTYRMDHGEEAEAKLRRQLERWNEELRDRVIYLGLKGGYTETPTHAIKCRDDEGFEPEPVPPAEIADYRDSIQARARRRREVEERVAGLLGTVQLVKLAIAELDDDTRRRISREVFALRGRINALEQKVRRSAA